MNIRILAAGLTAAVAVFCSVPTEAALITRLGLQQQRVHDKSNNSRDHFHVGGGCLPAKEH